MNNPSGPDVGGAPAGMVSIVLATFNGERFLRPQLDSLVAQSYRPIEIVASDDASSDGTYAILEEYAERHPGLFRVVRNAERVGLVKNFERALGAARGEYVAFCDQDDRWSENKLARLVEAIGGRDLVHSDSRIIDESGRVLSPSHERYSSKRVGAVSFVELLIKNKVTGCTALVRGDFARRAVPIPNSIYHDWWCAILASDGRGIAYLPEALTDYRQHAANVSGAKRNGGGRCVLTGLPGRWERYRGNRMERHRRLARFYRGIAEAASNRVSAANARRAGRLAEYYGSFFERRFRPSDFLFHCAHFRAMSDGKSLPRAVMDLLLSPFGVGTGGERGGPGETRKDPLKAEVAERTPLVSILIPTYNQAAYVGQAIESALAQDYPNLEVIVSDDCSSDGTEAAVARYGDPRLRYERSARNLGRVANYRRGLYELARGEWVLNLDGDDLLVDRTFIRAAVAAGGAERSVVLVFGDRYERDDPIDPGPLRSEAAIGAPVERWDGTSYVLSLPKAEARIHHLAALYRRPEALDDDFYRMDIVSSDYESLFRLVVGRKLAHIASKVAVWRRHPGNASRKGDIEKSLKNFELFRSVRDFAVRRLGPGSVGAFDDWLSRNVANRYYGGLRSRARRGDFAGMRELDRYVKGSYPTARRRALRDPKVLARVLAAIVAGAAGRGTKG